MGRISLGLNAQRLGRADLVQIARRADEIGLGGMWAVEARSDSLGFAHEVLTASEQLTVGTCVAVMWKRHPMQLAEAAATLDHLYPGRFSIGIGSGGWIGDTRQAWGQGLDRAVGRMREYIDALRQALVGQPVDYSGKFYDFSGQLDFSPGARVPVYVGAGGPQMCRMAAVRADGLFIETCPPSTVETLVETTRAAAADAGRDTSTLRLHRVTLVSVAETRDAARDHLRRNLLDTALTDDRRQQTMVEAGYQGVVESINACLSVGDLAGACAAIPDEVVDLLALALTPDDSTDYIDGRLTALAGFPEAHVVLYPYVSESGVGGTPSADERAPWVAEYDGVLEFLSSVDGRAHRGTRDREQSRD
jgi:alkanesulfonate monooxygenase SsuD/methylene tetrahydromethanopterin reductase-like flavin-dependent oxidoreductase (luciferase family)